VVAQLPRSERMALLDWEGNKPLPIYAQAHLLGLNRSGLYYKPVPLSAEELRLRHRIDEIFTDHPFLGSRRIVATLQREGLLANRKHVIRCMREMGLVAISPKQNTSRAHPERRKFPYLCAGVTALAPDHIWGTDITYVRMRRGWMYLVAVMDWHSRYVISWELDQSLELPFVLEAFKSALSTGRRPVICNSDQGSHFTSDAYTELLEKAGVAISMDGRGRCMDNIFTERLWRSYKYEEVYLHEYESPRECRQRTAAWFDFYNHARPHQALENRTPAEVYFSR